MDVVPVTDELFPEFCAYIADNSGYDSAAAVAHIYNYPWLETKPNYGFALVTEGSIVGTFGCIYSERLIDGQTERFCNTADWYVDEHQRSESIELLFAIIGQPDLTFTALTATADVTQILRGFGFKKIDPAKVIVPTAPQSAGRLRSGSAIEVITDHDAIRARLDGADLTIFDDLSTAERCDHLVVSVDGADCYCIVRYQKRKKVPAAAALHVGNPDVLVAGLGHVSWWLLTKKRVQALMVESELLPELPRFSKLVEDPRPPLFSSKRLKAHQVDSLYSELTR
jgi:hypothetical protein